MVSSILFLLFLIPIALIIAVGIPVAIGILVYRDARKRVDCTPILWALVAALAPCYIGLILYLIIRKDYPLKQQSVGGQAEYARTYGEPGQGFDDEQTFAGQTVAKKVDHAHLGEGFDHYRRGGCAGLSARHSRQRNLFGFRLWLGVFLLRVLA